MPIMANQDWAAMVATISFSELGISLSSVYQLASTPAEPVPFYVLLCLNASGDGAGLHYLNFLSV